MYEPCPFLLGPVLGVAQQPFRLVQACAHGAHADLPACRSASPTTVACTTLLHMATGLWSDVTTRRAGRVTAQFLFQDIVLLRICCSPGEGDADPSNGGELAASALSRSRDCRTV